jgi:hypothetical protein
MICLNTHNQSPSWRDVIIFKSPCDIIPRFNIAIQEQARHLL